MPKSNQLSYTEGLSPNQANYTPLSPLSFLARTAEVYPDRTALVYHQWRQSWADTYRRCCQLADALRRRGIGPGDTVAVMAPNIPPMFEAHFGVPMSGAVLNTLNIRLDAAAIAFMLRHARARVVLVDGEFADVIRDAVAQLDEAPLLIDLVDAHYPESRQIGTLDYEAFLATGDPEAPWSLPADEWDAISLNYTSGTTGDPKGVVYHHRGAYLNAVSNLLSWQMGQHPVYLWTVPMFHCNGWCFAWSLAAAAGVSVCLRQVRAAPIFDLIRTERVTHFCGAPIVLSLLQQAPASLRQGIDHTVHVMTAGAAPPAAVIAGVEAMGFRVTHVYGLTETYGPCALCVWHEDWDELPPDERARLKARQGVRAPMLEAMIVADPDTLEPVPRDGRSVGEVLMRGNLVMKGYLQNPATTERAFAGGWFHSGDLAVWHPDGYVEIKDRSKDIIISGGENISSLEVESVLYRHPAVAEAAVVAMRDEKWGEVPCAFVRLRDGAPPTTADELLDFCRTHLARFKLPKRIVFSELPKTATGKVQKFALRDTANAR